MLAGTPELEPTELVRIKNVGDPGDLTRLLYTYNHTPACTTATDVVCFDVPMGLIGPVSSCMLQLQDNMLRGRALVDGNRCGSLGLCQQLVLLGVARPITNAREHAALMNFVTVNCAESHALIVLELYGNLFPAGAHALDRNGCIPANTPGLDAVLAGHMLSANRRSLQDKITQLQGPISTGARVVVVGLVQRADLNNTTGTVLRRQGSERWVVDFDDGPATMRLAVRQKSILVLPLYPSSPEPEPAQITIDLFKGINPSGAPRPGQVYKNGAIDRFERPSLAPSFGIQCAKCGECPWREPKPRNIGTPTAADATSTASLWYVPCQSVDSHTHERDHLHGCTLRPWCMHALVWQMPASLPMRV